MGALVANLALPTCCVQLLMNQESVQHPSLIKWLKRPHTHAPLETYFAVAASVEGHWKA